MFSSLSWTDNYFAEKHCVSTGIWWALQTHPGISEQTSLCCASISPHFSLKKSEKKKFFLIEYIIKMSTAASPDRKEKSWKNYMFKSTGLIHEWLWYLQSFLFSRLISSSWNYWKVFTLSSCRKGRRRPKSYTALSSLSFIFLCTGHGKKGWLMDLSREYWGFFT